MPKFDVKCNVCNIVIEVTKNFQDTLACEQCGNEMLTLMPGVKGIHGFGKQPYDYLNGPVPDPKKIKSFANDRRKGGR
jgi:hypothetical protein